MKWMSLLMLLAIMSVPQSTGTKAQLDHLVVAIRSLDEGIAQFERLTGVKAGVGGKHPGRGTENALISFGAGRYLEIIAPQAGVTPQPPDQMMRTVDRLRIINWAIRVPDVARATATLEAAGFPTTPVQPGSRVTPSGETLEWSTFGLKDPSMAVAPFFINWSAATRHPSTTAPSGCTLVSLTIRDPGSDRLSTALGGLGVDGITFAQGPTRIEARLTCGTRSATLTTE